MDEIHLRLLKAIEANSQATQRELSESLGVSLGKANYCLKALVDKGWVKANNFRANPRKLAYAYLLTPSGIDAKARLTVNFLRRKVAEYEMLKREIEELQAEASRASQPKAKEAASPNS
jgi:EPS-associated MarR family transcriptional regulator